MHVITHHDEWSHAFSFKVAKFWPLMISNAPGWSSRGLVTLLIQQQRQQGAIQVVIAPSTVWSRYFLFRQLLHLTQRRWWTSAILNGLSIECVTARPKSSVQVHANPCTCTHHPELQCASILSVHLWQNECRGAVTFLIRHWILSELAWIRSRHLRSFYVVITACYQRSFTMSCH